MHRSCREASKPLASGQPAPPRCSQPATAEQVVRGTTEAHLGVRRKGLRPHWGGHEPLPLPESLVRGLSLELRGLGTRLAGNMWMQRVGRRGVCWQQLPGSLEALRVKGR